ncbi:MAG: hypothetical protein EOP48_07755 [Sphingobacteriales bacterium]|nr:MAG: hypothetical protein EOP48_07755 [Sphingobacteriales bacterium]
MRIVLVCLAVILLVGCVSRRKNISSSPAQNYHRTFVDSSKLYCISKIDSADNVFVIMAKRRDSIFRILLDRDSLHCAVKIGVGECFDFTLNSVFLKDVIIQKQSIHFYKYKTLDVPLGGDKNIVWDLFLIKNLRVLCAKHHSK